MTAVVCCTVSPRQPASRSRWEPESPLRASYRPPAGETRVERVAEQDAAAGGRAARRVVLADGRLATASIELKALPKSRRVYAYLRHAQGGRTVNRYVGEPVGETRTEALADAWRQAHAKGLLAS